MSGSNLLKVIETLKKEPELLINLNKAVAEIFTASGVVLTKEEKAELFKMLGFV